MNGAVRFSFVLVMVAYQLGTFVDLGRKSVSVEGSTCGNIFPHPVTKRQ